MTNTISPTGNPVRDAMVLQAINAARDDDGVVTLPVIQSLLPGDFDLSEQELTDVLAALDAKPAATAVLGAPIADAETAAQAAAPVAEPSGPSREEAAERVRQAHQTLARWRAELIAAGNRQRKARDQLATAVSAFIAGQQPVSRETLIRQEVAAAQQHKQDLKDGKVAPRARPRLRSVIDQTAYYGRGGSPAVGNFRRGGMTHAHAARYGYQKTPAPAPAPREAES